MARVVVVGGRLVGGDCQGAKQIGCVCLGWEVCVCVCVCVSSCIRILFVKFHLWISFFSQMPIQLKQFIGKKYFFLHYDATLSFIIFNQNMWGSLMS